MSLSQNHAKLGLFTAQQGAEVNRKSGIEISNGGSPSEGRKGTQIV